MPKSATDISEYLSNCSYSLSANHTLQKRKKKKVISVSLQHANNSSGFLIKSQIYSTQVWYQKYTAIK